MLRTKDRDGNLNERNINKQNASTDPAFPGLYDPGSTDEKTGIQNPRARKNIQIN